MPSLLQTASYLASIRQGSSKAVYSRRYNKQNHLSEVSTKSLVNTDAKGPSVLACH